MSINIEQIINRLRNDSPLLGRNARHYIADALEGLFRLQISHFGTSTTEAGTQSKFVNNVTPALETLGRGMKISVHFTHTNTNPNPTLNVSNTGSIPITRLSNWAAGSTVEFVYDGTSWRMLGARKGTTNPLMDNAAAPGTDNGIYSAADHIHPAHTHHGTSTAAAGSADKVVNSVIPAFNVSLLRQGVRVSVQFTDTNTHASPNLNVNNTGARPITNLSNWAAGSTVDFAFDGTNWCMISVKKTTDADPLMDSVAAAGTDNGQVAREDHIHPAYVHHGICTSQASLARKVVANVVPEFDDRLLREGVRVSLQFIETNTHANPTLSISDSQPIPITNLSNWAAGSTVDFVFGNGSWRMISPKKAGIIAPLVDLEANWSAGTDNGHLSNADHQHILYIDHHTDHITRGRFVQDRMPTSDTDNRVLLVREAGTSPEFAKVDLTTDVTNILPVANMDVYNISLGALNKEDVWNGVTFGPCTNSTENREFQFDEGKRLILTTGRALEVFDEAGGQIGGWASRTNTSGTTSESNGTGNNGRLEVISSIGSHGSGNVTRVEATVMYYRDMSIYKINLFAWANNFSSATTSAMQNVFIKVWRLN